MIAITSYLGLGVEINSVKADGGIEIINLPEEGYSGFRAKLFYVPGHYEALYQWKFINLISYRSFCT